MEESGQVSLMLAETGEAAAADAKGGMEQEEEEAQRDGEGEGSNGADGVACVVGMDGVAARTGWGREKDAMGQDRDTAWQRLR